jgi:hypothetical protein
VSTKPGPALHINEDLAFERREWFLQRVGWGALALILLFGLGGAFGNGPLSSAEAGDENLLRVEYQRFVRHGHPMEILFNVAPPAITVPEVHLSLSREYLSAFTLQHITPEPERTESTDDALLFVFAARERHVPLEVTFTLQPEKFGQHTASIALNTGAPITIHQFTYP